MSTPTLSDASRMLEDIVGVDDIDPDVPLLSMDDIDSLDLVEWIYNFQETFPSVPVHESILEHVDDTTTFRSLFDDIVGGRAVQAGGAPS